MSNLAPVLCVIPARYGSTRLPGKPLAEINGVPLVMWVYNCAASAGVFDKVIVATDDERIVEAVEKHGGTARMTSSAHRRGTERVLEVVQNEVCRFVVNLQGDEPQIPAEVLHRFVSLLTTIDDNTLLTVASHATIIETGNPHVVKVVLNAAGEALYFSRSSIPYDTEKGQGEGVFLKHKGIYGYSREGLQRFCGFPEGVLERRESLEQLRALEFGMRIKCMISDFESLGIDTPQDLAAFRARCNA
jgi:3-deoxy-manno-octulosonate cytidylyltransferase (CMP-KDO synthetase)